jgi:hypothetical protein
VIGHASSSPRESAGIAQISVSLQNSGQISTAGPSAGHTH